MAGGSGGGGMLRSVGRVARTATGGGGGGVTCTSFSKASSQKHSSITNLISIPPSSSIPPISVKSPTRISPPPFFDDCDWSLVDRVDENEQEQGDAEIRVFEDRLFCVAPTEVEVHAAVSDIKQIITSSGLEFSSTDDGKHDIMPVGSVGRLSSVGSDPDWVEPFLQISSEVDIQMDGPTIVYDAFHLLQTEPSFQRLVSSLSLDKAVWEAVLRNEAVQELRESCCSGMSGLPAEEGGGKHGAGEVLRWILDGARRGVVDLIERVCRLVMGTTFERSAATSSWFERRLRSSMVMSVLVLLVVVLSRARRG